MVFPDFPGGQQPLEMVGVDGGPHVVEMRPHLRQLSRIQVPQRQVHRAARAVRGPGGRIVRPEGAGIGDIAPRVFFQNLGVFRSQFFPEPFDEEIP